MIDDLRERRPEALERLLDEYRLLTERDSVGRLGVENGAQSVDEWLAVLHDTGWAADGWIGIRLFSDFARDDLDADAYAALLDLERAAGAMTRIVRSPGLCTSLPAHPR